MTAGQVRAAAVVVAVALLIAGCGRGTTGPDGSGPGASSPYLESPPPPEGTGPEPPQSSHNGGPSISVAHLPIGGAATPDANDPAQQCADVNLLAPGPIPAGVTVQLGDVSLSPAGIFQPGGSACGSDQPPCGSSVRWTASSAPLECVVPVEQLAGSDNPVTLTVSGTVSCTTTSECDDFGDQLDQAGNAHIELQPTATLSGAAPDPTGG